MIDPKRLTTLLQHRGELSKSDVSELVGAVHGVLRERARRVLGGQQDRAELQATDVVHEVFVRLMERSSPMEFGNTSQFYGFLSQACYSVIVDAARRREAAKRQAPGLREPLDPDCAFSEDDRRMLLLDEALSLREEQDPVGVQIAKLRLCMGLETKQAAAVLGLSERICRDKYHEMRDYLHGKLGWSRT